MSFKNGEKEDNCHLSDCSTMKLTSNHILKKKNKTKNNRQVQTKEVQQAEIEQTSKKQNKIKKKKTYTKDENVF